MGSNFLTPQAKSPNWTDELVHWIKFPLLAGSKQVLPDTLLQGFGFVELISMIQHKMPLPGLQ